MNWLNKDRGRLLILFFVLVRVPHIFYGLPAVFNSTEYLSAKTALGMAARFSTDPLFYIYPPMYSNILAVLYGLIYGVQLFFGQIADKYDFAVQFLVDPSAFYIVVRLFSLVLYGIALLYFHRFLKRNFDTFFSNTGIAFLGLAYFPGLFATYATQDIFLFLFSVIAVIYLIETSQRSKESSLLLASLFSGLAIGAKYNAGFLLAALILVIIQSRHFLSLWVITKSVGTLFIGFFTFNFDILVNLGSYINGFLLITSQTSSSTAYESGINYLWELQQFVFHDYILGLLLFLSFAAISKTNLKKYYPVYVFSVLSILYIGSWDKKGIDYLLPVFPWLVFNLLLTTSVISKKLNYSIKTVLIYIIILPSLGGLLQNAVSAFYTDTRSQVAEWVKENVKAGEILYYNNTHFDLPVSNISRITQNATAFEKLPDPVQERLLSIFTQTENYTFLPQYQNTPNIHLSDYVSVTEYNAQFKPWNVHALYQNNTEYILLNERSHSILNDSLHTENRFYTLVKTFSTSFITPGPEISVYQRQND